MAVADALALAEIIAKDRPGMLAEYESQRRAANERSIQFTRSVARGLAIPSLLFDPILPLLIRFGFARPARFEALIRDASTSFQT